MGNYNYKQSYSIMNTAKKKSCVCNLTGSSSIQVFKTGISSNGVTIVTTIQIVTESRHPLRKQPAYRYIYIGKHDSDAQGTPRGFERTTVKQVGNGNVSYFLILWWRHHVTESQPGQKQSMCFISIGIKQSYIYIYFFL